MPKVILFDTETTGLPKHRRQCPLLDPDCWPDLVSVSWSIFCDGHKQSHASYVVKPDGWTIPTESTRIHGITHEHATTCGVALRMVMDALRTELTDSAGTVRVVAHNLAFDRSVLFHAWKWRLHQDPLAFWHCDEVCTMRKSEGELKLTHPGVSGFKWPSLAELWVDTFHTNPPSNAHSAERDVHVLEQICLARWHDAVFTTADSTMSPPTVSRPPTSSVLHSAAVSVGCA